MNRVALVGAGCGRGTLTLRGAQLLSACACVVYDSLIDDELLTLVPGNCKKICAGKRAGAHSMPQEEINELLLACAREYPLTVRLKGGDPFVFGRGGEELAFLTAAGVACEAVPGVTSAVAAAERFGIPVTHRGAARAFTVLTARTAEGIPDFASCAAAGGTLVFLMAKDAAPMIADGLMGAGMSGDTPCAVISAAGMPGEAMLRCSLACLAQSAASLPAPMTVVVGMVCTQGLLGTYTPPPRIVVTGTPAHVGRVSRALAAFGLDPLPCAHLRIAPRPLTPFFSQIDKFEWLVFTSANGVEVFWQQMARSRRDVRMLAGRKIAAIGPATAEALAQRGVLCDLMPVRFTSEALAKALRAAGAIRERIALLRAAQGSEVLLSVGTQFDLYDTVCAEEDVRRAACGLVHAACVTFSSASGARAFLERTPLPAGVRAVCIGEETASAVRAAGYRPVVAEQPDAHSLARAVSEAICKD